MSASVCVSAVFTSDTPKDIKKKIGSAFSGGRDTEKEHRRLGAPPICLPPSPPAFSTPHATHQHPGELWEDSCKAQV